MCDTSRPAPPEAKRTAEGLAEMAAGAHIVRMRAFDSKFAAHCVVAGYVALGALLGCARERSSVAPDPPSTATPSVAVTTVTSGLLSPWDLAFAPDGSILFTEKCRGLSIRRTDGSVTRLFGTAGSALVASDLLCVGQSGVHGVALDPAFATNRRVYVYMASSLGASPANRVVRLELTPAFDNATNRTDIVTGIAYKAAANGAGGAGAHSGGRIRFGPDGFLYIGTGDNHSPTLPQHPTQLGGKVLRVTTGGAAAAGNNAPAGFDTRIYAFGLRNVQGIAFRPSNGRAYIAEHGPNHSDEVTALVAGGNGGWDPQTRPGLSCPDGYCGYAGNATTMPMTDLARFPGALAPTWNTDGLSRGMGPATFLSGTQWEGWNGALVVSLMAAQQLRVLRLDPAGAVTSVETVPVAAARYRSLVQGPDGALYAATDGGAILRIAPGPPAP